MIDAIVDHYLRHYYYYFQLLISKSAERFGVMVSGRDMFREVYAYYTHMYAGPDGNLCTAFYVSDRVEQPIINGVPIPQDTYVVRKELEIDLSMCTVRQFKGIVGESFEIKLTIASVQLLNSLFSFVAFWIPIWTSTFDQIVP